MKSNYFPHDYGARNDPKLVNLQMVMGALGLAIFWCLVELLWENSGYLPCMYDAFAYQLRWASAEDVRRVVESFSLFETDGDRFWSPSVLRRMDVRRSISGKQGGINSGRSRRENASLKAVASDVGSKGEAVASDYESGEGDCASTVQSLKKKRIKKTEIDIETNISNKLEEDDKNSFFEVFFFRNFPSPSYEVDRFWEHYANTNWTTSDGESVADRLKLAQYWKPKNDAKRFDAALLAWYKGVYFAVKNNGILENVYDMIQGLTRMELKGNQLSLSYRTKELAEKIRSLVMENQLQGTYSIDWRFDN